MNGMYQTRSGPWSGLASLAIVLMLIGGFGAIGFAEIDLSSFYSARAEAQKMEADTVWETELRQIDLPYIQAEREAESKAQLAQMEQEARVAEARTEAELDQIEAEKVATLASIHEGQRVEVLRNNQQLANEAQWSEAYVFGVRVIVTTIVICSGTIVTAFFIKKISMPQPVKADWKNADYRKREIALARIRERQVREAELEQITRHNGNLRHQPMVHHLNN